MPTIQVRDVPDDVHRMLRRRAAAAGMSLQRYLRGELIHLGRTLTPAEVAAAVENDLADDPERFADAPAAEWIRELRERR